MHIQFMHITFGCLLFIVSQPQHCPECKSGEHFSKLWAGLRAGEVLCWHFGRDQACWLGSGKGQAKLVEGLGVLHCDGIGHLLSAVYHR